MDHEDAEEAAKRFYATAAKVADLSEAMSADAPKNPHAFRLWQELNVLREDLARFRHAMQATGRHA